MYVFKKIAQVSSSEFEGLWKPQLHMIGAIVWGHLECYFVQDADQHKDSNMEATVVARCLDLTQAKLAAKGCDLPRSLIVQTDGTSAEANNQHFMTFEAFMTSSNCFEATDLNKLTTAHSHNEQDQRFSVCATKIARASILENPDEFVQCIKDNVPPAGGRELVVEILPSTYNFQKWFMPLNIQVAGIAATHLEPNTNHVWRIVQRRALLDSGITDDAIECLHSDWSDLDPDPKDAILLVKHYMHSSTWSQAPMLLLPAVVAATLKRDDLTVLGSAPLGERAIKEWRKTARQVAKEPWNLFKAQKYLEDLCDNNVTGTQPAPIPLNFIHNAGRSDLAKVAVSAHLLGFEPHDMPPVRRVEATAPNLREAGRRAKAHAPAVSEAPGVAKAQSHGPGCCNFAMLL